MPHQVPIFVHDTVVGFQARGAALADGERGLPVGGGTGGDGGRFQIELPLAGPQVQPGCAAARFPGGRLPRPGPVPPARPLRSLSSAFSLLSCSRSKASAYCSSVQPARALMPLRTGVVTIPTRLDSGSAVPPSSMETTAVTSASRTAAMRMRTPLCRKKSFTCRPPSQRSQLAPKPGAVHAQPGQDAPQTAHRQAHHVVIIPLDPSTNRRPAPGFHRRPPCPWARRVAM